MAFSGPVMAPLSMVADGTLNPFSFVVLNAAVGHSDLGVVVASTAGAQVLGVTDNGGQPAAGQGVEIANKGRVQIQLGAAASGVVPGTILQTDALGLAENYVAGTGIVAAAMACEAGAAGDVIYCVLF